MKFSKGYGKRGVWGAKPPPERGPEGQSNPVFVVFDLTYLVSPTKTPSSKQGAPPPSKLVGWLEGFISLISSGLLSYLELSPQHEINTKRFYITYTINVGFYFSPNTMRTFWLPLPEYSKGNYRGKLRLDFCNFDIKNHSKKGKKNHSTRYINTR